MILTLFLAVSAKVGARVRAEEPPWQNLSFEGNSVFLRGWDGDPQELQAQLKEVLPSLGSIPWLKDRLPSRWALLIDGNWSLSSGFWAEDLISPDGKPAVLITPPSLSLADRGASLIVHELTHMVHHALRPHEHSWMREGLAMMSEHYMTGSLNPTVIESARAPEAPLVSELDPRDRGYSSFGDRASRYGHIFLYFYYLNRICGGEGLMQELFSSKSPRAGTALIDETLKSRYRSGSEPACRSFSSSFRAFQVARFKQDPGSDSAYVVASDLGEIPVRERPPRLEPYSATVYSSSKGCLRGEVAWGSRRCIRIREK